MVRRSAKPVQRKGFAGKADLLAAGSVASALTYERASQDKKKQSKSVTDQRKLNLAEVDRYGWRHGGSFVDNDRSGSRHARREREQFELLIEAIRAGKGDVLVVWEISRQERDLAVYVRIRDMCTDVGLVFWLVGGVLYDLRDKNDRMMLGFQAVQAEWQADSIRDNVLRGIVGAAEAGRPHGQTTYGYRRIYNARTKAFERQEPDTEVRTATAADGTLSEYSHAGVVEEIFEKVAGGVPLITIENDLNARGVPPPRGGKQWFRGIIRKQAMNPAYIGKRVLRGEIVGDGLWPALVDEETYWACVRLLQDPDRTTTRAGRAVHLLSYIVLCGVCGGPVSLGTVNRHGWTGQVYSCLKRRCAAVKAEFLDEYVQRAVVAWLAQPHVYELLAAGHDDAEIAHARAEAQRLRADLEDYKKMAEAGDLKAVDYVRFERGLSAQIAQQETKAADAGIPPVLRGRIGEQAVAAWAELGDEVAVKREIIRTVAEIKLLRAGKGTRLPFGRHRLHWQWKFGPPDEQIAA